MSLFNLTRLLFNLKMGLQSDGIPLVLTLILAVLTVQRSKVLAADSCNWKGSGLDSDVSARVVRPVYLRCAQGKVTWTYPRGGLRILFQPRHTKTLKFGAKNQIFTETSLNDQTVGRTYFDTSVTSGYTTSETFKTSRYNNEFRVCFRVSSDFSGARIYLEGHRKLHLLYAGQDDQRPLTLKRCFVSVRGQAALYLEAASKTAEESLKSEQSRMYGKHQASFAYDIQPLSSEEYEDEDLECRPCSDTEILESYCKSEFVIKGHMVSLRHDPAMERSEQVVKVSKVIRDSNLIKSELRSHHATLYRPFKCGTKLGPGEFLMMGRDLLGDPTVTCAPRWTDWKRIRNSALLSGSNLCLLED